MIFYQNQESIYVCKQMFDCFQFSQMNCFSIHKAVFSSQKNSSRSNDPLKFPHPTKKVIFSV